MSNRTGNFTAKVSFAGLYLALFGWLLSFALSLADSWEAAVATVVLISPVVVLIGNFVIGPISMAVGLLATATAALIRFARS